MKKIRLFYFLIFSALLLPLYAREIPETYCPELVRLAEDGDSDAQLQLGLCYQYGDGVSINYPEAVKWYRKAAFDDNQLAMAYLGYCYYNGLGVPVNFDDAYSWWKIAADEGGICFAYEGLGLCYLNGRGVEQDYKKALECFREAALQGSEEAAEILEALGESR